MARGNTAAPDANVLPTSEDGAPYDAAGNDNSLADEQPRQPRTWSDEAKAKHAETMKAKWADPTYRKATQDAMKSRAAANKPAETPAEG